MMNERAHVAVPGVADRLDTMGARPIFTDHGVFVDRIGVDGANVVRFENLGESHSGTIVANRGLERWKAR